MLGWLAAVSLMGAFAEPVSLSSSIPGKSLQGHQSLIINMVNPKSNITLESSKETKSHGLNPKPTWFEKLNEILKKTKSS